MALITYDQESSAFYCNLDKSEKKRVAKTIALGEDRFLDLDESGKAIGIEVLMPKDMEKEIMDALIKSHTSIEFLNKAIIESDHKKSKQQVRCSSCNSSQLTFQGIVKVNEKK